MSACCTVCEHQASSFGRMAGIDGREYRELKCGKCGLAWTDPVPEFTEPIEEIYDEGFYAPSMLSPSRVESERRVVNSMADFVERLIPRSTFLDVGCGEGIHLALMRERGWDVRGVEVSRFAAEHARRAHNLDVFHGGLTEAGFAPESFALIQLRHVVEHLSDPRSVLQTAADLLQPGGMIRIDTPSGDFWRSGLGFAFRMIGNSLPAGARRFDASRVHLEPPMHLYCFTGSALRRLLTQCDLKVVKMIRTYHGDPDHYPQDVESSLFARTARGLDVASSKLNLGELLVVYARKNGDWRTR